MKIFALCLPLTVLGFCAHASAQNFNIDMGFDAAHFSGTPANTYGAAAAQPGFWNDVTDGAPGSAVAPAIGPAWCVSTLKDLAGNLTGVTTSVASGQIFNSIGDWEFNNAGTFGDDQALMDDFLDIGGGGSIATMTISGLQNGTYDVWTYSWAPDSGTFTTTISAANSTGGAQTTGGNWPGALVQGVTHAKHTITVTTNSMTITGSTVSGFGSFNGFQLKLQGGGSITAFCDPGTGGVAACPCTNPPSGAGRGCDNSSATGGASISGSGNASLASDTLSFTTAGEKPTATTIVLQGTASAPAGVVFGQGIRCVSGTLKRLYVLVASGGSITAPGGGPSVSSRSAALGDPISASQHRYYMAYYRDPIVLGGCPATSTFNGTNALDVLWQ